MTNLPVHLRSVTVVRNGLSVTTFTEAQLPDAPPDRPFKRGLAPMVYIYNHTTGCMRMKHPDLYSTREIMARSASGIANGARTAVPNDPVKAHLIAANHLRNYKPDGMDHSQRQLNRIRREITR